MSTGDGGDDMLSPAGSGPDVAALGLALEAALEPVGLQARAASPVVEQGQGGGETAG